MTVVFVAVASAAAVSACSDDQAVTCVDVMDRMAWCRPAVKDSSSAVIGARDLRRRARAAAASVRSASRYEASGISVIAIISRMTSG